MIIVSHKFGVYYKQFLIYYRKCEAVSEERNVKNRTELISIKIYTVG